MSRVHLVELTETPHRERPVAELLGQGVRRSQAPGTHVAARARVPAAQRGGVLETQVPVALFYMQGPTKGLGQQRVTPGQDRAGDLQRVGLTS